jgi:hypothetical protein
MWIIPARIRKPAQAAIMEMDLSELKEIVRHLGGEARLQELRIVVVAEQARRITLLLNKRNLQGVRTVVISPQTGGVYNLNCYGPLAFGSFKAPPRGHAFRVLPENLASALGRLTGVEEFGGHHF